MTRRKANTTLITQRQKSFAEKVRFPQWILGASVLLIGLMLFLGWIADADGRLRTPGAGAGLCFAAVIAAGAGLMCAARIEFLCKNAVTVEVDFGSANTAPFPETPPNVR